MALPKLSVPLFDIAIPSTNRQIKFRPFLVKEEKILLIAQASGSKKDIVNAMKQIINNCVVSIDGKSINVDEFATFDIEYLFLKIRAKSVENIIKLKYRDTEDDKSYEFEVDLDNIEIIRNENHTNKVKVNDEIGIIMKYPTPDITNKIIDDGISTENIMTLMISDCIDKIYDKDNVYLAKEADPKELDEFVDSMSIKVLEEVRNFFDTMPKLYHKIEYTNSKGTERVIELSSIDDFFTLG